MTGKIIVTVAVLLSAGHNWNAKFLQGTEDAVLKRAAKDHAIYMARTGTQGHQHWDARRAKLAHRFRDLDLVEIAAESWPDQGRKAAANEMFKSWYATRIYEDQGHWGVANSPSVYYGAAMAYSPATRTWYACVIVARPYRR